MQQTDEQKALVEGSERGENFMGEARAGAGKTTILKQISAAPKNKRKRVTLVVFNVKNANEIKNDENKPDNLTASTFHSLCLKTLGKGFIVKTKQFKEGKWTKGKIEELLLYDEDKCFSHFDRDATKEEKQERKENYDEAENCVRLLKNSYVNPSFTDTINLMSKYQISPSMDRSEFAYKVLDILKKSDEDVRHIDYDDMIRFCVIHGKCKNILADMFVLDEAQDNTPIRTKALGIISENCQVGAVGDDRQAAYFFAGAESDSIAKILQEVPDMVRYPLTVNFRCDKSIIREAQKWVPDIKYLDSKEEGEVVYTQMKDLSKIIKPGDVGISRYNAVIIAQAFRFIRQGVAATIQGADFGKMLKSQISGFKATSIEEFYARLGAWHDKQCKYSDNNPSEAVTERFECLKFLADNSDTVEGIASFIDSVFVDKTSKDTITFSTAHRAKGLEWNRVHVLDSDNFIAKGPNVGAEQAKQELNLMYIAITRARHFLNFCQGDKKVIM
jgi:superfamily I DNA/RNA helicase